MWRTRFVTPSAGLSLFESDINDAHKVGPILDSVLSTLSQCQGIKAYSQQFSLINLFYGPNSTNLGFVPESPNMIGADAGIAFTFSLSRIGNAKKFKWPKDTTYNVFGRPYVYWGRGADRLLTVFVPRVELGRIQANNLLTPQLRLIYNVVGAATRNLSLSGFDYNSPFDSQYLFNYYKRCKVNTVEQLFDDVPINMWIYCPKYWEDYGYMLFNSNLPADFGAYWCMYINREVYRFSMSDKSRNLIESTLTRYLAPAVEYLRSSLLTGDVPMRPPLPLTALISMILAACGKPVEPARFAEMERSCVEQLASVFSTSSTIRDGLLQSFERAAGSIVPCLVNDLPNQLVTSFLQVFSGALDAKRD